MKIEIEAHPFVFETIVELIDAHLEVTPCLSDTELQLKSLSAQLKVRCDPIYIETRNAPMKNKGKNK